jgi:hypothetical protein
MGGYPALGYYLFERGHSVDIPLIINSLLMTLPTLKFVVPGMLIAALLSVSASTDAHESESGGSSKIAPLFASHSPLVITIEAPLTTLMKERPVDAYLEGTFRFTGDDGTEQTLDLKLRTRGKYRRLEEHCDFAPIRLNFRKKQVVDTIFAGQDKLKLVTHCQNDKSRYEQLVLREYLAYRFLQVMTDKSFGVRLLQINYVDTEGSDPMTKIGFVIEDDDDVAERNGMRSVRTGHISSADLDRRQQNLINVFQYLIGNTEYSLFRAEPDEYCCHNTDLMSATEKSPFTPLAYDFDFAGIVNAPYAQPNPRYDIEDVRQRLYKGQCENNDLLPETIQQLLDKKDTIYAIVDELDSLDSGSRRYVTRYLNSSYDHISKPKSLTAKLINKCYNSS